jgi:hypothetical protein
MKVGSQHSKQVARAFGKALRAAHARQGISRDRLGNLCDLDSHLPVATGARIARPHSRHAVEAVR